MPEAPAPPDHVQAYRRDGYAVVRGVFGPDDVAALSEAFDRLRARALRHPRSFRHGNLCYRLADDPVAGRVVTIVQWASYSDAVLARYRTDPRLLATVAPLLGRDLKQIINQLHWKPPGARNADYAFHQDVRFRRPRAAFRQLDSAYIQTGIAVDPHSEENGAMLVFPGSHLLGERAELAEGARVMGAGTREAGLGALGLDPGAAVPVLLRPGDVALWHPFTVHGSGPNRGADQRRFYLNSYVQAACCDRGEWALRDGKPCALGDPALVHYEELYTRPEPHYLDQGSVATE